MQVSVSDKTFWFIFVELLGGFFASIAYMGGSYSMGRASLLEDGGGASGTNVKLETFADSSRDSSTHILADTLLPAAIIPVIFRSQLYTYEKQLSKTLNLTLFIITAVFYILGGVMILLDHSGSDMILTGIFAIVVAAILIVDMVFLII